MLVSAAVMAAVYMATGSINNLLVLLLVRIGLAVVAYLVVMKLLGSKMLDECIGYLRRKKQK